MTNPKDFVARLRQGNRPMSDYKETPGGFGIMAIFVFYALLVIVLWTWTWKP